MGKARRFMVLIIVVIVIGVGVYFGYKILFEGEAEKHGEQLNAAVNQPGIQLTTKEIEKRETQKSPPVTDVKSLTVPATKTPPVNDSNKLTVRKEKYYLDLGQGAINAPRNISTNINREVLDVKKIPETFNNFAIYLITVKDRSVGRETYAYLSNKEKIDLKAGDVLRNTDSVANLYDLIRANHLPDAYWSVARGICGENEDIRQFIKGYFTKETIKQFTEIPFAAILLNYEK